jgi:DNA polymerase-3 subunit epsilon
MASENGGWGVRQWWPFARSGRHVAVQPNAARDQGRAWARTILAAEDAWLILDLETTGVGKAAEIIEVAAITLTGRTLVDRLVHPGIPIPRDITRLTGIGDAMVRDAPRFAALYRDVLRPELAQRKVLVYNVGFDVPMLRWNIARHCDEAWEPVGKDCLMQAYARYRGDGRRYSLGVACQHMGIHQANAHRALGDCLVSAALLRAMAA